MQGILPASSSRHPGRTATGQDARGTIQTGSLSYALPGISTGAEVGDLAASARVHVWFGFSAIRLETGLRPPAAIRWYESLGYTRIAGFGDYKDDPLSVCSGKQLSETRPRGRTSRG